MNDSLFWTDPDGTAHERCQLLFSSTGELIEYDPGAHPEMRWFRNSWAFFCPACGDVWERIVLVDSRSKTRTFVPLSIACIRHNDTWSVPGSVLGGDLEGLLPLLPLSMLRREFEAHMNYYNKLQGEQVGTASTGTHGS